jgi:hypothetical protein
MRCTNATKVAWTTARQGSILSGAVKATIAFAPGTVAGIFQFCSLSVALHTQTAGSMPILIKLVVAKGSLGGLGRAGKHEPADGCYRSKNNDAFHLIDPTTPKLID